MSTVRKPSRWEAVRDKDAESIRLAAGNQALANRVARAQELKQPKNSLPLGDVVKKVLKVSIALIAVKYAWGAGWISTAYDFAVTAWSLVS